MAVLKGKEGIWRNLGWGMDIPRSKLNQVNEHYQTDVQRVQASLDHWRRTHPAPSWKLLARALREVGEEALAEEVARRYVRSVYMCSVTVSIV